MQTIVQVAPTTAIAIAVNYGQGSASATAIAAPSQSATQNANTRADDPAYNVGFGNQQANNTTTNSTNQSIYQYAPTNATATATNYGNGHASATAIAAPVQYAYQSANTYAGGQSTNVGLGVGCGSCGFGNQNGSNLTSNSTSQTISQSAAAEATATANSNGPNCGCNFNNGNATALAIARPVQSAQQFASTSAWGSASNVGFGDNRQHASNTTINDTDQSINQYAPTTATATATNNGWGWGNNQNAVAVATAQPTQLAIEGAVSQVSGSASNFGLGSGCFCDFGSTQHASNTTTNYTDQHLNQYAPTHATADATNNGRGWGNNQYTSAIAIASPSQSAGLYSVGYVYGSATNFGLGSSDQFAWNLTTNDTDQTVNQYAPSYATATATNNGRDGYGNNQSAQAIALARPSQSAIVGSDVALTGHATNANIGSSCGCDFGFGEQTASNTTRNITNQNVNQYAPTYATADATNNGFHFGFGEGTDCGFGCFGGFGSCGCSGFGSVQNATAIAAASPTQYAHLYSLVNASGQAVNTSIGSGAGDQIARNTTTNVTNQYVDQDAPATADASAVNQPGGSIFGHGNVQTATAVATAAPSQVAAENSVAGAYGSAANINVNSCSSCGFRFGGGVQHADNSTYNTSDQYITQDGASTADADAINSDHRFGFGGNQSVTAIAGAAPQQIAAENLTAVANGSATNFGYGSSCSRCDFGANNQDADNTTTNTTSQSIDQFGPADATANASNVNSFWSFGNNQSASAIAIAAPRQAAYQYATDAVSGSATNVGFGATCGCGFGFGEQDAVNNTYNSTDQDLSQFGPADADATATNYGLGFGNSQYASAIAGAAPQQWASQFSWANVSGSASNVGLGLSDQFASNDTDNSTDQSLYQDAPAFATANAVNDAFGFGGSDSATAVAGAAPQQWASQYAIKVVGGFASNAGVSGCGCGFGLGTQNAWNVTNNDTDQTIDQDAPAYATAIAHDFGQGFIWECIWGCFGGNETATAIATASPSQHASQYAADYVSGHASNLSIGSSCGSCGCGSCGFGGFGGCEFCGFGNNSQNVWNTSNNNTDQLVAQDGAAWAFAHSRTYPGDIFWSPCGSLCGGWWNWGWGGGCSSCGPGFGNTPSVANVGTGLALPLLSVPSVTSPTLSAPATAQTLIPGGNWVSNGFNLSGPSLGVQFGLGISNVLNLNVPTANQLLGGVSLFGLLSGATSLSLNLSVTTPWVQAAIAVAHVTPFQVLFSVSQAVGIGPWLGLL